MVVSGWLIENPAQQAHWQNGEQLSSPVLGLLTSFFIVTTVTLLPLVADVPSAQGITLKTKTRIAMKKAKIFISGAKIVAPIS